MYKKFTGWMWQIKIDIFCGIGLFSLVAKIQYNSTFRKAVWPISGTLDYRKLPYYTKYSDFSWRCVNVFHIRTSFFLYTDPIPSKNTHFDVIYIYFYFSFHFLCTFFYTVYILETIYGFYFYIFLQDSLW